MAIFFENLHNGAFVVTKLSDSKELYVGFYHDVLDTYGDTLRMFEPLAPLDEVSTEEIMNLINKAK